MKNLIFIIAFSFIINYNSVSQTITSTAAGGHWNTSSTWIGGVVPVQHNDVIINGPVIISNVVTNNLIVNSSGSIEDEPSAGRSLTVNGNFVNYGLIKNSYAGVSIYAKGSVSNFGTMINSALCFNSSGAQSFSSPQLIGCSNIWKDPNGEIIAAGNIVVDSLTRVYLDYDVLNMGTYKLTKLQNKVADTWFTGGTIFSNDEIDVSGINVMHSNLDGNFILVGNQPMECGNITVLHDMKIAPGKIIQDECCAGRIITIKGNLFNEGIVRNGYGGLFLYVEGNVINNGQLLQNGLRFSGDKPQYISGTQKFSPSSIWKDPNGQLLAASAITIDSITRVYLDLDTLNMGTYKLTKLQNKTADTYFTGGVIYSNSDIDVSGINVMRSNLDGNFTLVGNQPMECGDITVFHDMKIAPGKIITDECCAGRIIFIKGNLINEGIVKNSYGGLQLYVEGNVINKGEMIQSSLRFSGNKTQYISGTQMFSPGAIWKDPNGQIIAASSIVIDSVTRVYLDADTLQMGSFKLTKLENKILDNWFSGGLIHSTGEIDASGINVMRSNLAGDFTLTGNNTMECGGISVYGNMTVAPGKVVTDECCAGRQINVYGNLYNYGTIRNAYGGLALQVEGNLYNFSNIAINWISIRTEGFNRRLSGIFNSALYLQKTGTPASGIIETDGYVQNNAYTRVDNSAHLKIPLGGSFICKGEFVDWGSVDNQGTFYSCYRTAYNDSYSFDPACKINIRYFDKSSDSTFILVNNNSPHPIVSSSIKRWWRITANGKINSHKLTLYYDENILNGNDEDQLEAFLSPDSGKTWLKISNPFNTTRDKENNVLYVGTDTDPVTSGFGDIIISSVRIVNYPSISSSISGRKQIRVGPPNRYTINYWNNDNFPTNRFAFVLQTNSGVYIKSVFSKEISSGKIIEIPVDSINYDGFRKEVIFVVEPLAAREARSFDIILTAEPGLENAKPAELITFTAVALWVGGAILEEYISNTIVEGCYEMWRPVEHDQSLKDASLNCVKNSLNRAVTVENGLKGVAKKAAEEIVEKTGRVVVWPAMLAKDVFDCLGNTIKGMKDYVNGNFDKQEKELVKVTSWDPNAKEGPGGVGENGYMAVSAPMLYTIFFENKKEATAAAYQIVIIDTIDPNVFDVNTVEFKEMSHSMGVASRQGNILKWDFTEIELPPNLNPPEGEGWVKFIVHTKENLSTGTQIKNSAVIKFDLNPWLATNDFINTLDFDSPVTTPTSLIPLSGIQAVALFWNSTDGGSGIKNSSVYMSVNDGPYSLAAVSDSNSAVIQVNWEPDYKYKLYVLSQDKVGNTEKNPTNIMEIVTGLNDHIIIPEKFDVSQNYPNPFNPETRINYAVPERGFVELKIFNILGEEIAKLINEEKEAGYYNLIWNAANYSSGIYIYKLSYKGKSLLKKMMLIK